jgi:D-alanine-D-alanine ligase
MRVGLVFGGRSVEHLVSLRSARTVHEALQSAGHDVVPMAIATDGRLADAHTSAAVLQGQAFPSTHNAPIATTFRHLLDAGVDVVFPIAHGTYGEDGCLQGLCEILDVAYVGCSVSASAAAMDKRLSKELFAQRGLPIVPFVALRSSSSSSPSSSVDGNNTFTAELAPFLQQHGWPLFVKPSVGGSSVGCRKVRNHDELDAAVRFAFGFDSTVIVEKCVTAREVEVAVLGDEWALRASELGEIVPGNDFYDYEDKYLNDNAKLLAPAPVDAALKQRLQQAAMQAMAAVGGSGMARVDFFVMQDGSFALNEINTLPGFTNVSMYPRLWGLSGVPLPKLVDELVHIAVRRQTQQRSLQAALHGFVDQMKRK